MKVVTLPTRTNVEPKIDLETIYETLCYMRDDVARSPGLANVANALDSAMKEIEAARRRSTNISNQNCDEMHMTREPESILASPTQAQFVPFTRAF